MLPPALVTGRRYEIPDVVFSVKGQRVVERQLRLLPVTDSEESISLFEKIARDGIAATAASRMGLRDDPFGRLVLIPIGSALAQLLLKCLSSRKTSACESSHWYRPVEEPVRCYNCSVRSPILERGWRDLARIIRPRPVPKAVMTHFHMSLLRQSIFAPGNELFVCHEVPVLKENASIRKSSRS
jgi:hypothetical protein